jgi:hypothetical protein
VFFVRECPQWFQEELTRIGGTNPYGDPVFRLVWSTSEKAVIGGRWANGFEGYKESPSIAGTPSWALMVWEPKELQGSPEMWDLDYRDPETGYLQCGGYPKYGRYRLMKKFIHREMSHKLVKEPVWIHGVLRFQEVRKPVFETFRMEPCGLMLDLMLPMLIRWRRLSDEAKVKAIQQDEELRNNEVVKKAKDIREGCRVRRGSQLVAKRAEVIERGFEQTMRVAARSGLGIRIGE